MDGNYKHDLDLIFRHVGNSEVFAVFFPHLRKSLVVDMRPSKDDDGAPLIKVMPLARSANERIRTLKRLRPGLPRANHFTAIPWVAYVRNLITSGVWTKVMDRIKAANSPKAEAEALEAIEQLMQFERQEMAALITGQEYETIWSRS